MRNQTSVLVKLFKVTNNQHAKWNHYEQGQAERLYVRFWFFLVELKITRNIQCLYLQQYSKIHENSMYCKKI